jgi:hypothetical protein
MTSTRPEDQASLADAFGPHVRHRSHTGLFTSVPHPPVGSSVDAIIVPTLRPVSQLKHAIELAEALRCPLVALCSGEADPAEVQGPAEIYPIDIRRAALRVELVAGAFAARFVPPERFSDLSLKRNIGLALAHMVQSWNSVLFLDDDVVDVSVEDLVEAAAVLPEYTAIGIELAGMPDNSVVCHAFREVGGEQSTFVGGGAMLVPTGGEVSHFPDVYNEDWLFLLRDERLGAVGRMGYGRQQDYDPYDEPYRAELQEFGDCLAEGAYALLDDGRTLAAANREYWAGYLDGRRRLIDGVVAELPLRIADDVKRAKMAASLAAAATRLSRIAPDDCVEFLTKWRRDCDAWRDYLRTLPQVGHVTDAITHLGLQAVEPAGIDGAVPH